MSRVLVTGSSDGLGLAAAQLLAQQGTRSSSMAGIIEGATAL